MKRLLIPLAALALVASCAHNHSDSHGAEADEAHDHHGDLIELDDHQAERFGVKTDTVAAAPFATVVSCSAVIERSAADASTATAPLGGTVKLAPGISVGASVSRGALIATVNPAKVSGGDSNRAAKAALDAARREVDRLKPLVAERLATITEYNAALAALESAEAAYSPEAGSGRITAPAAGIITTLDATDGSYVQPGQPVATIAASNRLTLHAEVPASEAAALASVTDARIGSDFTLSDHGGRREGISSENGYGCIYFSFVNDGTRVPGAAVEAYLLGAMRPDVITVPLAAVSEQQGEHYVYRRHSPGHYEKLPVSLGASDGRRIEITAGLHGGEEIVSAGAMTVRLAESSGAVPEGHSHSH